MARTCLALLLILFSVAISAADWDADDLLLTVAEPVWARSDQGWIRMAGLREPVYGHQSGRDLLLELRRPVSSALGDRIYWIWGTHLESAAIGGDRWCLVLASAESQPYYCVDLASQPTVELHERLPPAVEILDQSLPAVFGAAATYDGIDWVTAEVRIGAGKALASAYWTVSPPSGSLAQPFVSVFAGLFDILFDHVRGEMQLALILGLAWPP